MEVKQRHKAEQKAEKFNTSAASQNLQKIMI